MGTVVGDALGLTDWLGNDDGKSLGLLLAVGNAEGISEAMLDGVGVAPPTAKLSFVETPRTTPGIANTVTPTKARHRVENRQTVARTFHGLSKMRLGFRWGKGDANTGSSLIMTAGTPASSTRVALTSRSDGSPTSAVSLPPVFVVANVVAVIDCDVEPEGPIPGTATAPGLEALRLLCCEVGGDCLAPTSLVWGVESWGFGGL